VTERGEKIVKGNKNTMNFFTDKNSKNKKSPNNMPPPKKVQGRSAARGR